MKIVNYNIRPFVVCVQELSERTEFILKHFREIGLGEVEVFNGISAKESGLVTEHTYEIDNPGTNYRIGRAPVACWLSFYMLWSALNLQLDSHFMTLEYDAEFAPDWRARTEQALRDVPSDFDILFLGSCCTKGKLMKHIKGQIYEVQGVNCGHATIIAKKALPVLLKTQRRVYAPLDLSLCYHSFQHLKVYVLLPRCVGQFNTHIPE